MNLFRGTHLVGAYNASSVRVSILKQSLVLKLPSELRGSAQGRRSG